MISSVYKAGKQWTWTRGLAKLLLSTSWLLAESVECLMYKTDINKPNKHEVVTHVSTKQLTIWFTTPTEMFFWSPIITDTIQSSTHHHS